MDFFIFDRPPQALDENIVEEAAASLHRNRHAAQQIGINLVAIGSPGRDPFRIAMRGFARAGARNPRTEPRDDSHQSHPSLHVLAIDLRLCLSSSNIFGASRKMGLEMQFVDATHRARSFVAVADLAGRRQSAPAPATRTGAARKDRYGKIALAGSIMAPSISMARRSGRLIARPLARKSRSTVGSPILA